MTSDQENRLNEVYNRLKNEGITVTERAQQLVHLSIDSIVLEPGQYWPNSIKGNSQRLTRIQDAVIDTLDEHLMAIAPASKKIEFFDSVVHVRQMMEGYCPGPISYPRY